MNYKIKSYKLVYANHPDDLSKEVVEHLDGGWNLYCPPMCVPADIGQGLFSQAMVVFEENKGARQYLISVMTGISEVLQQEINKVAPLMNGSEISPTIFSAIGGHLELLGVIIGRIEAVTNEVSKGLYDEIP